jgi:hypothetical protein
MVPVLSPLAVHFSHLSKPVIGSETNEGHILKEGKTLWSESNWAEPD